MTNNLKSFKEFNNSKFIISQNILLLIVVTLILTAFIKSQVL